MTYSAPVARLFQNKEVCLLKIMLMSCLFTTNLYCVANRHLAATCWYFKGGHLMEGQL